jgi:hypothetical protein
LFSKRAAEFMAASMGLDPNRKDPYSFHAEHGIKAAKAFFLALTEHVALEKAKADELRKAEAAAIPSSPILVP